MKLKLIVSVLTLWQVYGEAEIILNNPIIEFEVREKKLESVIQELSTINAGLMALRAEVDAAIDHVQSIRWLHDQILPDGLKGLEKIDLANQPKVEK